MMTTFSLQRGERGEDSENDHTNSTKNQSLKGAFLGWFITPPIYLNCRLFVSLCVGTGLHVR